MVVQGYKASLRAENLLWTRRNRRKHQRHITWFTVDFNSHCSATSFHISFLFFSGSAFTILSRLSMLHSVFLPFLALFLFDFFSCNGNKIYFSAFACSTFSQRPSESLFESFAGFAFWDNLLRDNIFSRAFDATRSVLQLTRLNVDALSVTSMSHNFIDLLRTKLWAHCVVIESLSSYFISVRIAYRDGEIIASYRIRVLIKLEQSILFVSLFTFTILFCVTQWSCYTCRNIRLIASSIKLQLAEKRREKKTLCIKLGSVKLDYVA